MDTMMLKRLHTVQTQKIMRQDRKTSPIYKVLPFYSCKHPFYCFFCSVCFMAWNSFMVSVHLKLVPGKMFLVLCILKILQLAIMYWVFVKQNILYQVIWNVSEQKKIHFLFNIRHHCDVWNVIVRLLLKYLVIFIQLWLYLSIFLSAVFSSFASLRKKEKLLISK